MHSCLYTGWVRHRRFAPRENHFRYRLFMSYLDLEELPGLFDRYLFWSARRAAPAWFRRADFHGDAARPLSETIRDLVAGRTGARPTGPIRLLTHLRFFGYSFNGETTLVTPEAIRSGTSARRASSASTTMM